jgi:hypothetical protein
MTKTTIIEFSNPGERIEGDYIEKFMKDVRKWSPEGIDYTRHLELTGDFTAKYAKRRNPDDWKEAIQGVNEINLAVNLYNTIETKGSCN